MCGWCRSGRPQLLHDVTELVVDGHFRLRGLAPAGWADGYATTAIANEALNTRRAEGVTASQHLRLLVGILMMVLLPTHTTLGKSRHHATAEIVSTTSAERGRSIFRVSASAILGIEVRVETELHFFSIFKDWLRKLPTSRRFLTIL
mmetsp:Transcript_34823/g.100249  ORF Transcript_34823/g.100249 Transcript_34823/m.100249 type:complete len:147 (-) Transcript_34823:20-460(-)